jgi:hypothetical protein
VTWWKLHGAQKGIFWAPFSVAVEGMVTKSFITNRGYAHETIIQLKHCKSRKQTTVSLLSFFQNKGSTLIIITKLIIEPEMRCFLDTNISSRNKHFLSNSFICHFAHQPPLQEYYFTSVCAQNGTNETWKEIIR